jgi:hypothetical protein
MLAQERLQPPVVMPLAKQSLTPSYFRHGSMPPDIRTSQYNSMLTTRILPIEISSMLISR